MCLYGDSCKFGHPKDVILPLVDDRQRIGKRQKKRVYNVGRSSALRRWLLHTFGRDYLSSGSGVLDVAGGSGELSFELVNLNDVPSTVFDPRDLVLTRVARKLVGGLALTLALTITITITITTTLTLYPYNLIPYPNPKPNPNPNPNPNPITDTRVLP